VSVEVFFSIGWLRNIGNQSTGGSSIFRFFWFQLHRLYCIDSLHKRLLPLRNFTVRYGKPQSLMIINGKSYSWFCSITESSKLKGLFIKYLRLSMISWHSLEEKGYMLHCKNWEVGSGLIGLAEFKKRTNLRVSAKSSITLCNCHPVICRLELKGLPAILKSCPICEICRFVSTKWMKDWNSLHQKVTHQITQKFVLRIAFVSCHKETLPTSLFTYVTCFFVSIWHDGKRSTNLIELRVGFKGNSFLSLLQPAGLSNGVDPAQLRFKGVPESGSAHPSGGKQKIDIG